MHYWERLHFEIPYVAMDISAHRERYRCLRENVMLVVRDYKGKVCLSIDPAYCEATPPHSQPTVKQNANSKCPDVDAPDAAALMRYFPGETEETSLEDEHTGRAGGMHGDY